MAFADIDHLSAGDASFVVELGGGDLLCRPMTRMQAFQETRRMRLGKPTEAGRSGGSPGEQGFRHRIRRCEDEGVSGPAGRPTGQVSARRAGRCTRTRELR